ncbi:sulfurtransferase [Achromobacter sp. HZ01]|uniref:rhodanese-like domain-containing protein n=1 Tax=Achromobacter sp. HZ01 TaxID=1416886 RepID=UPI000DC2CC01|nr:sulfurtransferase [Achromobacter sp. HZ01]
MVEESVSAAWLKQCLESGAECAVIDPREEGAHSVSPHLFHAVNLPLSQLELRAPRLFPRRDVPIVVAGGGDELDRRAQRRLRELGYTGAVLLEGGSPAWGELGLPLFTGFNTASKAFGEYVEHGCGTPSISADELRAMLAAGRRVVIMDSRTPAEHRRATIPGSVSTPGAELVLRYAELAQDTETTLVVNCAGRTRSIIGAQSLINAGVPNPVYALRNGTMGWSLAGHQVETQSSRRAPEPGAGTLDVARRRAAAIRERFRIGEIDAAAYQRQRDGGQRSVYLFDVRSQEEFETGHLPQAVHAPGGQLVQATDTYVAVRNARIVLYDPHGVRDVMTASWLRQMGHDDVLTLRADTVDAAGLISGPQAQIVVGLDGVQPRWLTPAEAARGLGEYEIIDLGSYRDYRAGHLPGARWLTRSRLADALRPLPPGRPLLLVSPDGVLAELGYADVAGQTDRDVHVLQGGMKRWRMEGLPLEEGEGRPLHEPDDAFVKPFEAKDREAAMRAYLGWEVGLLDAVQHHPAVHFNLYKA